METENNLNMQINNKCKPEISNLSRLEKKVEKSSIFTDSSSSLSQIAAKLSISAGNLDGKLESMKRLKNDNKESKAISTPSIESNKEDLDDLKIIKILNKFIFFIFVIFIISINIFGLIILPYFIRKPLSIYD